MKKKIFSLVATIGFMIMTSITAFAGEWIEDDIGWWYKYDKGGWPANKWEWIDGNKDGIAECYCFNDQGYMYSDTVTPDGYTVDKSGAWMEKGYVKIKYIDDSLGGKKTATNKKETIVNEVIEPSSEMKSNIDDVLKYTNEARLANGLWELELDSELCKAAQLRAQEISNNFSHTRPNGTNCFTVFEDFGIERRTAGENIAYGQANGAIVVDDWMHSEGHRANILNSSFNKIGIGCLNDGNALHWVQIFMN